MLGLYSLTGWFIGLQNAKYPLYVAIVQNLVNIAASLFFVFVWHMDVAGVALGTVIAQYCGLTLSLYYCHRMHRRLGLPYTFVPSSVFREKRHSPFLQCQPRHFPAHPLPRVRHSLFHLRRFPSRGIYLSGQCLADAILHPLFLFHGRFRLCRRSPLG